MFLLFMVRTITDARHSFCTGLFLMQFFAARHNVAC